VNFSWIGPVLVGALYYYAWPVLHPVTKRPDDNGEDDRVE
tara:strand:- start:232 stop:351 length:120 start_codon:yes stop_codon:yes gene_type:complete